MFLEDEDDNADLFLKNQNCVHENNPDNISELCLNNLIHNLL